MKLNIIIDSALSKAQSEYHLDIRLCAGYTQSLTTSDAGGYGYKFCRSGEIPERRLCVIFDEANVDHSRAVSCLLAAFVQFWNGTNTAHSLSVKVQC